VNQTVLKKKQPEKFNGAAAYNKKFDSKWCSKYLVKVSSSQPNFWWVFFFSWIKLI